MKEYAVYKGDSLICIGTAQECAAYLGVEVKTILFYSTPAYRSRVAKRSNAKNYMSVVRLDD